MVIVMVRHIKFIGLTICGALFTWAAAHGTNSEQTLKNAASKAIAEFKVTGNTSPLWHTIAELMAQPRGELLSVCAELLNALYEVADPAFDVGRTPFRNISPGGPYPAGIDPESIKDPKIKAEYQKKLADNFEYSEYYTQQYAISRAIDELAHGLRQSFNERDANEVLDALVKNGLNSACTTDLLRRMEQQTEGPH